MDTTTRPTPAEQIKTALTDLTPLWERPGQSLVVWKEKLSAVESKLLEALDAANLDGAFRRLFAVRHDPSGTKLGAVGVVLIFGQGMTTGHAAPVEAGATLTFFQHPTTGLVQISRSGFCGPEGEQNRKYEQVLQLEPHHIDEVAAELLADFVRWSLLTLPGAVRPDDLMTWRTTRMR